MGWLYSGIVIVPVILILGMAFYARRYIRDVSDYLACGRVAGRYIISVGDLAAGLSVITFVAYSEQTYQCGMAMGFWSYLTIPVGIFLALTGWCVYRYRATRCLSLGQFLEVRYSRRFRIVAAAIRTLAEMVANAIGPAIAVRFFIYFLGLPNRFLLFGWNVPTYGVLVVLLVALALAVIWPAGRVSLLITDSIQGMLSYPIFLVFTVFVLCSLSWFDDAMPVMFDRAPGESFLNPMDVAHLRDFNVFALVVSIVAGILNRAAWIGNDTTNSGRTPHEQKMAGILGTWRNGFAFTMMALVGLFVIVFMLSPRFAPRAHDARVTLCRKVAAEVVSDAAARERLSREVAGLPVQEHTFGVDPPYSRQANPDTPFLDTAHKTIAAADPEQGNARFQQFRSLYFQMMMPVVLRSTLPPVLVALLALLMVMLLISTDDSRIFNAAGTIIQDVVVPLRKSPLAIEQHIAWLRRGSLAVALFFVVVSLFFAQLDYINMFITIMCSVWLGAAGPIIVGGLYTRFGTTTGAWSALVAGSGSSIAGLFCQRNWADRIYPFLAAHGLVERFDHLLRTVSAPFQPLIVWKMDAIKFPINSYEIYFIAMLLGCAAYVVGSLLTRGRPFNLDRMLHRGAYSVNGEAAETRPAGWNWRQAGVRLIGITADYTRGDKAIAWSVFLWSVVWSFGCTFVGVLIWNAVRPWPKEYWGVYFFIIMIVSPLIVGTVSTVWFIYGGLRDLRRLFRDLNARAANPLDDGRVEGHVSLADRDRFARLAMPDNDSPRSRPKKEEPQV